ncbi:MAG: beta-lactamase family protein [Saprospiraceae bacterium]|nr:beta-lactamase family protein [Saprospiraceae bacterium]
MTNTKHLLWLLLLCSLSSCHLGRFVWFNYANITDHKIFPYTEVETSDQPFRFTDATDSKLASYLDSIKFSKDDESWNLDEYLDEETRTVSFVVVKNDSLLFEKYYEGYDRDDIANIFSVSKSVTSLLVGIALDEGKLKSVDDPITDYIPELKEGHPYFQKLTLQHLLDMRSGIDYDESYTNPFKHMAKLYYGKDQLGQIVKMDFSYEPGTVHEYQSVSTTLLGIAVEKATGMELGNYLETKVWKPMGMENRATWSVDDKRNRTTKAYCCLNTTAIDLAKIARLYLNKGMWNGQRIVSEAWIDASTTPKLDNDSYQNQWYSVSGIARKDGEELIYSDSISAVQAAEELGYPAFYVDEKEASSGQWHIHYGSNDFYALGILGQHIFIDPDYDLIIVRLGEKYDDSYFRMYNVIRKVIKAKG